MHLRGPMTVRMKDDDLARLADLLSLMLADERLRTGEPVHYVEASRTRDVALSLLYGDS